MSTQGISDGRRPPRRAAAAMLIGCALLVGIGVAWLSYSRRQQPVHAPVSSPHQYDRLAALRSAAEAGDSSALSSLVDALRDQVSPDARALVVEMLRSRRPEIRAPGTAWIGRQRQQDLAALLVPRMSDADWRVRAAAFDALRHVAGHLPGVPTSPAPLRDTPVDAREEVLFAWVSGLRSAGQAHPVVFEQCELYAPAGGHWLSGTKLAQSCLACHAPPDPYPAASFEQCVTCHPRTHAEWAASSHARSTTHVNLLRVDERTKQVTRVDPGPREGLVCTTCHLPDTAAPETRVIAGTENLPVPHRFKSGAAAASCAACHAETQGEFEKWRVNPRPIASTWLPGDFTWDEEPDTRTCVSCHLRQRPAFAGGGLAHGLGARRDVPFMRGGLSARIEPPTGGRAAQLVLTNLAGHRYPSGTIRRAVRVELSDDIAPENARLLTRLTDSTVPTTQPTQGALAPGEQRRFELPVAAGVTRVTCSITFERNQFEPGSYELPLHRVTERVAGSVGPVREGGR